MPTELAGTDIARAFKFAAVPAKTSDHELAGVSVFLPCHNEEGNVLRVVTELDDVLSRSSWAYEIIVVDDGSSDRTGQIADELAAARRSVRVVHHRTNRGYGAAVISGIRAAAQPWVVLCDGDGQFEVSDVLKLLGRAEKHDIVVGRRVRRADPLMRRINGRAWTVLIRLLLGVRIADLDCGLKLFRRDALNGIDLQSRGAMISAELMAQLTRRGLRICEVDVQHLPRLAGEQSGANLKVIFRAFKELFVLYGRLKQSPRIS
jgi:glycosyltransferase involved in cell wall biosynthesis